jgi:hypothetical protein
MKSKRLWATLGLCALLVFALSLFTEVARAQDSAATKQSDSKVAQRQGVSGSLAQGGGLDEAEGTTKTQAAIGLGSCVVAFIVVKYL